ncbi:MAG: sulfotransferase domain-containing protein [Bacteroidales bacterium]|nr:sulfotransferase domain-containing protein [Bacteroidales bacterium]
MTAQEEITSDLRQLPEFIIPGVQKGGTSSLFSYLAQHPRIQPSRNKEIHFFDHKYDRGIEWYRNSFPVRTNSGLITGEASPYYFFHPLAALRISTHCPGVKLIVLLRDPVARAYSHYMMIRNKGYEPFETFEEALAAEPDRLAGTTEEIKSGRCRFNLNHQMYSYLARGMYHMQVQEWLKYFQMDQFLFIKSELFFDNPKAELLKVYDFLGIEPIFPSDLKPVNTNIYHPILPETNSFLINHFEEDVRKLAALIGDEFNWWD